MKTGFKSQGFFIIVILGVVVLGLIQLNKLRKSWDNEELLEAKLRKKHKAHVENLKEKINNHNRNLKVVAYEIREKIQDKIDTMDRKNLDYFLAMTVDIHENVYGLGLCSTTDGNFAPFFVNKKSFPIISDSVRKGRLDYNFIEDSINGSWFKEYSNNNWIQPYYGVSAREYVFEHVIPILNGNDTSYFIYVDGAVPQLTDILRGEKFNNTELKYLLTPSNKVLSYPSIDYNLSIMEHIDSSRVISSEVVNGNDANIIINNWLGKPQEFFIERTSLDFYGWKLISLIPITDIQDSNEEEVKNQVELVVCILSIIILIVYFIHKSSFQNFATSIILIMTLALIFELLLIVWLTSVGYKFKEDLIVRETILSGEKLKGNIKKLSIVVNRTENIIAKRLEKFSKTQKPNKNDLDQIIQDLRLVLNSNPDLFGIGFCWNADSSVHSDSLFAPFLRKGQKYIELPYDYRDKGSNKGRWFQRFIEMDSLGGILDPYFGEAAQQVLLEYGKPIYGKAGEKIGVLYVDYSFDEIKNILISTSTTGNTGFSYLTKNDSLSRVLYIPDSEFFERVRKNYINDPEARATHFPRLYDYAKMQDDNNSLTRFAQRISSGQLKSDGISIYTDNSLGAEFYRSHVKLDYLNSHALNWILVTIYPIHEEPIDYNRLKYAIIRVIIYVALILVLIPLTIKRSPPLDRILSDISNECFSEGNKENSIISTRSLKTYSWYISVVYLIGIVCVCVTTYKLNVPDFFLSTDESKIFDRTGVEVNIDKHFGQDHNNAIQVPLGLQLESLEIIGIHKVGVGGHLWTKSKVASDSSFLIMNATSYKTKLIKKQINLDGTITRVWNFSAILHQHFDYALYPFDNKLVTIKFKSKIGEDVLLIPDFQAFKKDKLSPPITDPDTKICISPNVDVPKWVINRSFFSIQPFPHSQESIFGHPEKGSLMLNFNIVLNRNILGALIGEILPFLVISIFLYSLIMIMKPTAQEKISYIDTAAALFFSLLFSHYKLRDFLQFKNVVFIEALYFVLYLAIIVYIAIRYHYHEGTKNRKMLEYRNNLLSKISFWPLINLCAFLVSILFFLILF